MQLLMLFGFLNIKNIQKTHQQMQNIINNGIHKSDICSVLHLERVHILLEDSVLYSI